MSAASDMLAAVEAAILAKLVNGAVQSYMLPGGRNVQSFSLKELYDLRASLKTEVASAKGGSTTNYATFGNPT
jgi:hypothetical protein